MSMTVGDIIRPSDVPSAIQTKISDAVAGYTGPYTNYTDYSRYGVDTNGKQSILNKVTEYTTSYEADSNDIDKGAYSGRLIKPYAVLNLIYKSIREACRLGTITYQKYTYTGYANRQGYRPSKSTYTVNVIYNTVNSNAPDSAEAFCAAVAATDPKPLVSDNGNAASIQTQANFLKGKLIRVVDITDLLDKCVALCRSATRKLNKNLGCINTCYNSCHSNCHGSSRSRR